MPLWKKLLILPPLALGVALLVVYDKGRKEPERRDRDELARPVRVLELAPREVIPLAIAYGTVRPSKTWVATAEISGRVLSISPLLKEGEVVPRDHELIKIDDTDQRLEVARLTAEADGLTAQIAKLDQTAKNTAELLEVEKRSLTLTETELERLESLSKEGGPVSIAEADTQRRMVLAQRGLVLKHENTLRLVPSERAQLEAQLAATAARVKLAVRNEKRAVIRTPFPCRIETTNVEVTQAVAPGQALAVAYDVAVAEIEARVGTEQAGHLFRPSDRERVVRNLTKGVDWSQFGISATIRLRLPSRTYTWQGRFARAAPTLDAGTRTAGIVIAVDRPFADADSQSRPPLVKGMFVEVELRGPPVPDRLVVPRAAVRAGRLYTVDKENRLRIKPVEIDFVQGDDAVLASGVQAGERVVVTDLIPAVEGMLLAPATPADPR
ncbi:MAG: efflux RND transporter periplasmic adaptor subunit [Planctomycetota bacterium]|nr:efflux RND transporter periplasmic adaptor subunit [Planctomycetota bacterium]